MRGDREEGGRDRACQSLVEAVAVEPNLLLELLRSRHFAVVACKKSDWLRWLCVTALAVNTALGYLKTGEEDDVGKSAFMATYGLISVVVTNGGLALYVINETINTFSDCTLRRVAKSHHIKLPFTGAQIAAAILLPVAAAAALPQVFISGLPWWSLILNGLVLAPQNTIGMKMFIDLVACHKHTDATRLCDTILANVDNQLKKVRYALGNGDEADGIFEALENEGEQQALSLFLALNQPAGGRQESGAVDAALSCLSFVLVTVFCAITIPSNWGYYFNTLGVLAPWLTVIAMAFFEILTLAFAGEQGIAPAQFVRDCRTLGFFNLPVGIRRRPWLSAISGGVYLAFSGNSYDSTEALNRAAITNAAANTTIFAPVLSSEPGIMSGNISASLFNSFCVLSLIAAANQFGPYLWYRLTRTAGKMSLTVKRNHCETIMAAWVADMRSLAQRNPDAFLKHFGQLFPGAASPTADGADADVKSLKALGVFAVDENTERDRLLLFPEASGSTTTYGAVGMDNL